MKVGCHGTAASMAVSTDIMRTWRRPRTVIRKYLDMGRREDRAIAYLMAACLIIFIGQLPVIARWDAGFDVPVGTEEMELSGRLGYAFLAWMMMWPLAMYLIAALVHVIALVFGGKGSWYSTRLALFWTLLATTPALLLYGLMAGFNGQGVGTDFVGYIWLIAFLVIGFLCVREAEKEPI